MFCMLLKKEHQTRELTEPALCKRLFRYRGNLNNSGQFSFHFEVMALCPQATLKIYTWNSSSFSFFCKNNMTHSLRSCKVLQEIPRVSHWCRVKPHNTVASQSGFIIWPKLLKYKKLTQSKACNNQTTNINSLAQAKGYEFIGFSV